MASNGHPAQRPIGVFDSGVGGLTVVRALRAALPNENIVYLGDTARVPYGSKSPRTVERYAVSCASFLLERDVKLVMAACNTVSATALPAVAARSPVPVIGAVEPGARAALEASATRRIGVIGTLATIRSEAYIRAIGALDSAAHVRGVACPLLAPLAEEGWIDDDIARAVGRRYLTQLFDLSPELDTLVLGCTHYPLLAAALTDVAREVAGRPIAVVDSASAMAATAADVLAGSELTRTTPSPGTLDLFATDTSRLDDLAPRFLGTPIESYELVDL